MEVSNIIGTFIERKEGKKTVNKLHVLTRTIPLCLITLYYIGDMDLIMHDSERTKKKITKLSSNDIGHLIGDKVRLN